MTTHPWLLSRRQIFDTHYQLPPEGVAEVDNLFAQMEQLAMQCSDQAMFEQQLAASPLTQTYNGLLAKFASYYVIDGHTAAQQTEKLQRGAAASAAQEYVTSGIKRELHTAAVQAMPEELRRLKFGGLRVVPVIGPIIQWMDNFRWFRSMFTSKKG